MRRKEIISGIIIATLLITSSKQINTVDLERTFFTFTNLIPSEDYQNSSMKLKLNTLHEPIFISNDGNFTDYGFPGSGSKANPYRIENLNITTDFSNGITINSTSQYFVINNCLIQANSKYSIFIENIKSETAIIKNNFVDTLSYHPLSIFVNNSAGCQILNNTGALFENVKLENSSFCLIKQNHFFSFTASKSPNCTIEENIGKVVVEESDNCMVSKNNIPGHLGSKGISIFKSSYCIISENSIYNHSSGERKLQDFISVTYYYVGYGMFIEQSSNCSIVDNLIINSSNGIFSYFLNFSSFIRNTITGNSYGGLILTHNSFSNLIYHNRFIENGYTWSSDYSRIESQAVDNGASNQWHNSKFKEGNYWSEHTGRGIYEIDGSAFALDPYPLAETLERLYNYRVTPRNIVLFVLGLVSFVRISLFINKKIGKKHYRY